MLRLLLLLSLNHHDLHRRFDNVENAPYSYNAGGVKAVQDRAEAETDPDVLAMNGDGDQFPLYYGVLAENGNYLETEEIAKRHGVCGDPRLVSVAFTLRKSLGTAPIEIS